MTADSVIPGEVPSTDFPAVRGGQERREEDQLHLAACARGARLHLRHSEGLRNIILLGSLGDEPLLGHNAGCGRVTLGLDIVHKLWIWSKLPMFSAMRLHFHTNLFRLNLNNQTFILTLLLQSTFALTAAVVLFSRAQMPKLPM